MNDNIGEAKQENDVENIDVQKPAKKGLVSRFKDYMFNRSANRAYERDSSVSTSDSDEKSAKDTRKINEYLDAIETQLGSLDEQNKILLYHLSTVKENNEALLQQITLLSRNNKMLFEQFQNMKRREKTAKIVAIIASCLAIGFWVWKIISIIMGNPA